MKKILAILLIVLLLVPITTFAKTYKLSDTDITVDLDDEYWVVLTRDNINDEEYLKQYDLTYDFMDSIFKSYNAYLDAFTYWDNEGEELLELFVIVTPNKDLSNINLLEDDDVLEVAKEVKDSKENITVDSYDIYENKESKFIVYRYQDKGLYLEEYITIINNKNYILKFQSSVGLDETKLKIIEDMIVDKVDFDYSIEGQEKIKLGRGHDNSIWFTALKGALLGTAAGAVGAGLSYLIKKKKNK